MKIYTKTGDRGQTALFGGARVSKASERVDAYGGVDELNSALGMVRAVTAGGEGRAPASSDALLHAIQSQLFSLGAELACVPDKNIDVGVTLIDEPDIERLERAIDELEADLPALKTFVLPGGCEESARLHVARTVCRRAERQLVGLSEREPVRAELVRYLNRLSDLLFVMARHANHRANVADVPWLGRNA